MAVTKEAVLERLSAVKSPDGAPLPATGTLSDIVVSDGKVFFSINVDAAELRDPVQVDEHGRRRGARLHHVDERLRDRRRSRATDLSSSVVGIVFRALGGCNRIRARRGRRRRSRTGSHAPS